AGASAVVMYSLFEEEVRLESENLNEYLTQGTGFYAEAMSYFPEAGAYRNGGEQYLEHIRQAKESLDIPVIASLNGVSTGGWLRYARQITEAGADALELNMYYLPTDPDVVGSEVESGYLELLREVVGSVDIPIAVKLSPFFSSIPNFVKQVGEAGAQGAVLFNRFYQPDLDIEKLEVVPDLVLSDRSELRLPLRWIAILYGRVPLDLALTTGVHTAEDAIKGVMAGAAVTMMASELLQRGVRRLTEIEAEMSRWMDEMEYESIRQMRGSLSQINSGEPAAFERANYMRVLASYPFP
ncbi:MAG: dihydroorotate dehydrogenase-like protein, partial [Anaerolineales bacterium]